MRYRLKDLEISDDNSFEHDKLSRRDSVEFLSKIIADTTGPYVLAINSPWGTGKTTFVRMLEAELKKQNFQTVYFNAWEVDYMTDPLVAMVAAIDEIKPDDGLMAKTFAGSMAKVKEATTAIVKRLAMTGVKVLSSGIIDPDKIIDAVTSDLTEHGAEDIVEAFKKQKERTANFKESLKEAVENLKDNNKNHSLIFFIDELDRCRPTFAIELLERVKHIFDVENIIFLLSIDKMQLQEATKSIYGNGINAPEYLRRFIDLEYTLPTMSTETFVGSLFTRFGLENYFNQENTSQRTQFVRCFTALADIFELSLRVQERCFAHLKVVLGRTEQRSDFEPTLVALLILVRMKDVVLYENFVKGRDGSEPIMAKIKASEKGNGIKYSIIVDMVEGQLIQVDRNVRRRDALIAALKEEISSLDGPPSTATARKLTTRLDCIGHSDYLRDFDLSILAKKIDLASELRN